MASATAAAVQQQQHQQQHCAVCDAGPPAAGFTLVCLGLGKGGCGALRHYCTLDCRSRDWSAGGHRDNCRSQPVPTGSALDKELYVEFAKAASAWGAHVPHTTMLDKKSPQGDWLENVGKLMHEHCVRRTTVVGKYAQFRANPRATHSGAGGVGGPGSSNVPAAPPRPLAAGRVDTSKVLGHAMGGLLGSRLCTGALCYKLQLAATTALQHDETFLAFARAYILALAMLVDNNVAPTAKAVPEKKKRRMGDRVKLRKGQADKFVNSFGPAVSQHYIPAAMKREHVTASELLRTWFVEWEGHAEHALAEALGGGKFKVVEVEPGSAVAYGDTLDTVADIGGWSIVRFILMSKNQRSGLSLEQKAWYAAYAQANRLSPKDARAQRLPVDKIDQRALHSRYEPTYPCLEILALTNHLETTTQASLDAGTVQKCGGRWPTCLFSGLMTSGHVQALFSKTIENMPAPRPDPTTEDGMRRHMLEGFINMRCPDQARTTQKKSGTSHTTADAQGMRRQHVAAAATAATAAKSKRAPAAPT